MRNKIIFILLIAAIFLSTGFKKIKMRVSSGEKWSGQITWSKTSKSKGRNTWLSNGMEEAHRWDLFFEFKINAQFAKSKGTVNRVDITSDWQKDSVVFVAPENKYLIEETTKTISCRGQEISNVEVEFDMDRKNYWIRFDTPVCPEYLDFLKISNIYGRNFESTVSDHQGIQITLPPTFTGQPIGNSSKTLSGKWQETIPAPNDPGGGAIITTATWNLTMICPPWKNQMTDNNIASLDPRVKPAATRFVQRVHDELCINLKVTYGRRTIQEQDWLYAQGRTRPGPIVTNARGKQGNHTSGTAIDVYIVLEDGSIDTGGDLPPEVIRIAKEEGFQWGGDWKGPLHDGPHFEMKLK